MIEAGQLKDPTVREFTEILNLWKDIPGRTCTVAQYLDYLMDYWKAIAIFTVRLEGRIVGFIQCEEPGPLDPKSAFIQFAVMTKDCTPEGSRAASDMMEQWMADKGATKLKFSTVRSPAAFTRAWKMKVSNEVLMEKDLDND